MSYMTIVPNKRIQVNGCQLASGLMVVAASHVADARKDFFFPSHSHHRSVPSSVL